MTGTGHAHPRLAYLRESAARLHSQRSCTASWVESFAIPARPGETPPPPPAASATMPRSFLVRKSAGSRRRPNYSELHDSSPGEGTGPLGSSGEASEGCMGRALEEQGAWGRSRGARVESKNRAWVRISSGQVGPGDVERVFGGRWSWAEETET